MTILLENVLKIESTEHKTFMQNFWIGLETPTAGKHSDRNKYKDLDRDKHRNKDREKNKEKERNKERDSYLDLDKNKGPNLKFDQFFELYINDIEKITDVSITESQKEYLKTFINSKDVHRLSLDERRHNRKDFNGKKHKIIEEWEKNTGRQWGRYEKDVFNSNGIMIRKAGQVFDAHHIIENSWGGPAVWQNMHPARHPNEHQQQIHRVGGYCSRIFGDG